MNYQTKQVGTHRGAPRLYFQAQKLASFGFKPGERYSMHLTPKSVQLKLNPEGSFKVSGKGEGDARVPVIDINNAQALAPLGDDAVVKVVMEDGLIKISRLASVEAAGNRLARLKSAIASIALVAGIAFGGGILDNAAHQGLANAGIATQTAVVNEIDADLLDHARLNNPVLSDSTQLIAAPMQEAIQDDELMARLPQVDFLFAGIPCSGASRAGRSKNVISMMEAHTEVGHLAHAFLVFLQRTQPGVFLLENVPEYADTASAQIIRQQARDMGYATQEVILDASDFGSLERRIRWFMVGGPQGVEIDLQHLPQPDTAVRTVADVLDAHTDHRWGTFDYLKDKAVRDKAAGKGFQMQVVDLDATRVPTLRKGYHKGGSTDPLLQHPDNANLLRLFSGDEHARIKGVDPKLVAGLSNTDKHILLGQGVCPGPVVAIMQRVGECLKGSLFDEAVDTTAGYRLDRAVG
jgi:DNA (cytosine-5)-methyltransferase 1